MSLTLLIKSNKINNNYKTTEQRDIYMQGAKMFKLFSCAGVNL